jgi:hypothetical protein
MSGIRDRWETRDGSRPDAKALDEAVAKKIPLVAFRILENADAFEGGAAPQDGPSRAKAWLEANVTIEAHGAPKEVVANVRDRIVRQLAGNVGIVARLTNAPRILLDIVPPNGSFAKLGFPAQVYETAAGLFWGDRSWKEARVALRREHIESETALVEHELAHAVFSLALAKSEQDAVYRVLRPVFGDRASMDEVFAIYSEMELSSGWNERDARAPGVYGYTRRQWSEDHLFTRFVRKLWFPFKLLAGKRPPSEAGKNWNKFSGAR